MYNFRKKKRTEGEYGSVITSQNEKIFHGEHGIVNLVKEPTGTKYTRITKDDVRLEISFLQKDECDTIQLVPKIVDIDGREWDCCIIIIKSGNFIKCSASLGSVCNTDYTDISIEDYHKILDAIVQATNPNKPFRLREDILKVMYELNNLQIQTFVETFGNCLGFYGISPIGISTGEPLVRKKIVKNNETENR